MLDMVIWDGDQDAGNPLQPSQEALMPEAATQVPP